MFNRISSKLRSRSSSSNSQRDKSFAYGKMQKPDQSPLTGPRVLQSDQYSSAPWTDHEGLHKEEEEKEEENYGAPMSYAESLFPVTNGEDHVTKPGLVAEKLRDQAEKQFHSVDENFDDRGESVSSESFYGGTESTRSYQPSSTQDQDIQSGPAALEDYEDAEEEFLGQFEEYFEHLFVDNIRKEQYPNLDLQRLVYLDYANCGLFSNYQVQEYMRVLLEEGPYVGSVDSCTQISTHVSNAQDCLLRLFNTDRSTYSIIFTSGLTAGFRLIGEAYPFQKNTPLLVSQDSHEAIKKVIGSAAQKGVKPILAPVGDADLSLQPSELRRLLSKHGRHASIGGLFCFPLQSCATGVLHSTNWIAEAQQHSWQVMVDASTYLTSQTLDLSLHQPDYVLGSALQLLGYPPGVGFVLVRKGVFKLRTTMNDDARVKFVPVSTPAAEGDRDCIVLDEERVLNPLTFAAIVSGLRHLETVGHDAIRKRVRSLSVWLLRTLSSLRHKGDSGSPLARVYGSLSTKQRGNIIAFNVLDSTGSEFPPSLVQRLAEKDNIIFSAGHLCSPGLVNLLGKGSDKVRDISVFERQGHLSLVRVSMGPMTTFHDVYRLAEFLSRFRDEESLSGEAMNFYEDQSAART